MKVVSRTSLVIVLASTICASMPASAQPDLSGVWEPIPEASVVSLPTTSIPPGVPPPPPPPRTVALTITRQGDDVIMERRLAGNGAENVLRFTYAVGGSPTVNHNGPIELTTRAAWEGDVLVLTSSAAMNGRPFGSGRERYELVDGTLVVESTRQWPTGVSTSRDVHRRR